LTLSTRPGRVQVLTILVPFIRETRHMDVCPETGSGRDPDLKIEVMDPRYEDHAIVTWSQAAPEAVSRVRQAAYVDAPQGRPGP